MAAAAPPPSPSAVAITLPEPTISGHTLFTRIRLATIDDVPHIHKLIHQLAVAQRLTQYFQATIAALCATIFPPKRPSSLHFRHNLPPRTLYFTVPPSENPHFTPLLKSLHVEHPIHDPEKETFKSHTDFSNGDVTVGGFVLFFPNYSPILAKPGFYIQNILVRECYRRKGMGKMLLSAVAAQAAKMGYAKVELMVVDWNVDAIKFYEQMGAEILPGGRFCMLYGEALSRASARVNA